jgi:hypothetical protein
MKTRWMNRKETGNALGKTKILDRMNRMNRMYRMGGAGRRDSTRYSHLFIVFILFILSILDSLSQRSVKLPQKLFAPRSITARPKRSLQYRSFPYSDRHDHSLCVACRSAYSRVNPIAPWT